MKKKILYLLILTGFGLTFYFRLRDLNSDPISISWSKGIFIDPGIYANNSRNKILFGTSFIKDNNFHYFFPVHYLTLKKWFEYTGTDYYNLNIFASLLSISVLFIIGILIYKKYGLKWTIIFIYLFGVNFTITAYSRIAYVENTMLLFAALSVCFLLFKQNYIFYSLSLFSALTAFFSKSFAVVLFPSFAVYYIALYLINKNNIGYKKIIISLFLTVSIFFSLKYFLFDKPYTKQWNETRNSKLYTRLIKDHIPDNYLQFIVKSADIRTFLNSNVFYKMPVISLCSIFFLFVVFAKGRNNKPENFFLAAYIIFSVMLVNLSEYTPFRYRMILFPALMIVSIKSLRYLTDKNISLKLNILHLPLIFSIVYFVINASNRLLKLKISINSVTIICIIFSLFFYQFAKKKNFNLNLSFRTILIIILINSVFHTSRFIIWHKSKTHDIYNINSSICKEISGSSIAGFAAPILSFNSNAKSVHLYNEPYTYIKNNDIRYFILRENEYRLLLKRSDYKNLFELISIFPITPMREKIYFGKYVLQ